MGSCGSRGLLSSGSCLGLEGISHVKGESRATTLPQQRGGRKGAKTIPGDQVRAKHLPWVAPEVNTESWVRGEGLQ